eukprot:423592-Amphidinium_carterae.1
MVTVAALQVLPGVIIDGSSSRLEGNCGSAAEPVLIAYLEPLKELYHRLKRPIIENDAIEAFL